MVTETEARSLERLCAAFSSLTEENKEFTLDVSQALLTMQAPGGCLGQAGGKGKGAEWDPWGKRRD
jgi:hypothetical protein